jgi:peptidoglycan-associated lipoprotein
MKKSMQAKLLVGVLCLSVALVLTGGCKHRPPQVISPGPTGETRPPEKAGGEGLPEVDLTKLLWSPATGLQKVYFDYNKYDLRPDAIKTLNENAEKIKQALKDVPTVLIQIEGHCDERGTQEYNLALGEKRALAVREYLIKLGISGDHLVTISYGKERPVAPGHDESAWKQNRRCEFNKATPGAK